MLPLDRHADPDDRSDPLQYPEATALHLGFPDPTVDAAVLALRKIPDDWGPVGYIDPDLASRPKGRLFPHEPTISSNATGTSSAFARSLPLTAFPLHPKQTDRCKWKPAPDELQTNLDRVPMPV